MKYFYLFILFLCVHSLAFSQSASFEWNNATCSDPYNGSVTITVTGYEGDSLRYTLMNTSTDPVSITSSLIVSDTVYTFSGLDLVLYSCFVNSFDEPTIEISNSIESRKITALPYHAQTHSVKGAGCRGEAVGTAEVSVAGGVGPFSYNWAQEDGSPVFTDTSYVESVAPGKYYVSVTDDVGCVILSDTVTIDTTDVEISHVIHNNVLCKGESTGDVTVSAIKGTGEFQFNWSDGSVGVNNSQLSSGAHYVVAKDEILCRDTAFFTITEPAEKIAISLDSSENLLCKGIPTGKAYLSTVNGVGSLDYQWSDAGLGPIREDLYADSYKVKVFDENMCKDSVAFDITEPATYIQGSVDDFTMPLCYDDANGTAKISATDGTPGYTYKWSDPDNDSTFNNASRSDLRSMDYIIEFFDAHGCVDTVEFELNQPDSLAASIVSDDYSPASTEVLCFGDVNLELTVAVTGGTTPIQSFDWASPELPDNQDQTLGAGSYSVLVTDANNCTATDSHTITEPPLLEDSLFVLTPIDCNGETGRIGSAPQGGVPPYTYNWSNAASEWNSGQVLAGEYSLTITDDNGCVNTESFELTQPDTILVSLFIEADVCNDVTNGKLWVEAQGGTVSGDYSYEWNTGETTDTIENLIPEIYSVTVTDDKGCQVVGEIDLRNVNDFAVDFEMSQVLCPGQSNGSVNAIAINGSEPYTYEWETGFVGDELSDVPQGNYEVTVTDVNGCQVFGDIDVTTLPAMYFQDFGTTPTPCNENWGSAYVEVVSGGAPYMYQWSNGETVDSIGNLAVDFYSVIVTDTNGCQISKNFTVQDTSSLIVSAESDNVKIRCSDRADGTAIAYASMGEAPYTYEWSHGASTQEAENLVEGLYFVYARDNNNCVAVDSIRFVEENVLRAFIVDSSMVTCNGVDNGWAIAQAQGGVGPYYSVEWSNGEITNLISNLTPGVYTATMTDANACEVSTEVTVTEPEQLSSVIDNTTSVSCGGMCDAQARVLVDGGSVPYSYTWSSSETDSAASNLCVGWQYVQIRDAQGCKMLDSVDIVDTIPRLELTSSTVDPDCNTPNGKINVAASGGFAPYTYQWGTGDTNPLLEDILPGVYSLTLTDDKGCALDTILVLNDNSDLSVDDVQRRAITYCLPCNESYRVLTSGGVAPYSYSWSNGDTLHFADSLCTDQYYVTVTDDNECKRSAVFDVEEKPIDISLVQKKDIVCYGDTTGLIEVIATDGVSSNYTYTWSNDSIGPLNDSLVAGEYTVTVSEDSSVCAVQKLFIVEQSPELRRFFITDMPSYCKDSTGEMHVEVLNAVAPVTYLWEDGTTSPQFFDAYPEYIGITITDGNGCVVKDSAKVDDVSDFSLYEQDRYLISCIGDADGTLEVGTNNGYAPFTYSWDHEPTNTSKRAENLAQGVYTVYVEDSRNCLVSHTFNSLQNPDPMTFSFVETRPIYCNKGTGDVTALVSGGHPGYKFFWYLDEDELIDSTLHIDSVPAGTLKVHVRDSRQCLSDTVTYDLQEPPKITVLFSVKNTGCVDQAETGRIIIDTIFGHNPPYKFQWHNSEDYTFYDGLTNVVNDGLSEGTYAFRVEDSLGICFNEYTNYTYPLVIDSITTLIGHTHCNYYLDEQLNQNVPDGEIELGEIITKYGDYSNLANYSTISDFSDYTISWNDKASQTDEVADNLIAGNYQITLSHGNGCTQTFDAGSVDALVNLTNRISTVQETIFDRNAICLGDSLRLESHPGITYTHDYVPASETPDYSWNTQPQNVISRLSHKSGATIWAKPMSSFYVDSSLLTVQYSVDGCYSPSADFIISHHDSLDFALEVVDIFDNYVGDDSVFAIKNEYFLINPIPEPWYVYESADEDGIVSVAWSSLNEIKDARGHLQDTITNQSAYVNSEYYGLHIKAVEPTYYYATATTRNGCVEKASVAVNVYENMYIPNLITPNGDGQNEVWEIPYLYMCPNAKVTIHNRWGVKVFESDVPYYSNPWDGKNDNGKLLPMNAYYYLIEFNDAHSTSPKAGIISILY